MRTRRKRSRRCWRQDDTLRSSCDPEWTHKALVNIKNQDTITKILDMVPDMVDKFTGGKDSKLDENDVKDILDSVDVQ